MEVLVKGALVLHVNPGPDVQARKIDDLALSPRYAQAGMAGYAIKSHYLCTAERAKLVNRIYPQCRAIGAITLNNSVGGLNPVAVEIAARAGAKIVWMPTTDSLYERQCLFHGGRKDIIMPYWATILQELDQTGIPCPPITLRQENGKLKREVYSILEIAKKEKLCVATAHISHEDAFAMAEASHEIGFERLLISHVLYTTTTYSLEEQLRFLRLGALLEYCYSTFTTKKTTYERTLELIRAVGPQNCIISSDLGMPNGEYPDIGMMEFSRMLYRDHIPEEMIHVMNRDNPAYLIDA